MKIEIITRASINSLKRDFIKSSYMKNKRFKNAANNYFLINANVFS